MASAAPRRVSPQQRPRARPTRPTVPRPIASPRAARLWRAEHHSQRMAVPAGRVSGGRADRSEMAVVHLLQLVLLVVLVGLLIGVGLPALLELAGAPFR
jgi:hypothetical protein